MPRTGILPALVVLALSMCLASSADARRRHHGYYGGYGERSSPRNTLDEWRARQAQGQSGEQSRDDNRDQARGDDRTPGHAQDPQNFGQDRIQDRERDDVMPARATASGAFGGTIDKLVGGCAAQAAELANWPLDDVARTVAPDETQRNALEALRGKAKAAGERLSAECPRDVPSAPVARLEAAEQGIAATVAAFDTVEPALKTFYGALNDEQKARLYRDTAAPAASNAAETTGARDERRVRPDYSSRRHRLRAYASVRAAAARETKQRRPAAPGWSGSCEDFAAALRNWPVGEIERDVRLVASAQRIAFYELVTASLKTADTLATACPAEVALTPVGRMEEMRQGLAAVRAAAADIRPALLHFYEALDQDQKLRFAGIS